ncbi:hypothetical protein AXG93_2528s1200 [Marchantia polymorpha subsp. ruderalis]|uniref:Uncharacterized protein n=1 Tax=Marchantia polymorpha subsp. ruderalis TaxID=1480154 RepID=A0A176WQF7_MARPO|nr:hypothetical protein AXG93_2528s1200 [Marchantia polymorpha subsp. ruderalis]
MEENVALSIVYMCQIKVFAASMKNLALVLAVGQYKNLSTEVLKQIIVAGWMWRLKEHIHAYSEASAAHLAMIGNKKAITRGCEEGLILLPRESREDRKWRSGKCEPVGPTWNKLALGGLGWAGLDKASSPEVN